MKFMWRCETCGQSGEVPNEGLPITSLINKAAFQHIEQSPDCPTARTSEISIRPGGIIFCPSEVPPATATVEKGNPDA